MGIPVYFKTLINEHQDDILITHKIDNVEALYLDLNCLIIGSSIVGEDSIKRSYSALHIFKKSLAGFLLFGSNANSTDILRENCDH